MAQQLTLIFRKPDGTDLPVEASVGQSVMESAVMAGVPGIEGECGGCLSCATCHVYAPEGLTGAGDDEDAMLEETETPRRPESRLSCQIRVTADMDGAVFGIPGDA